MSTSTAENNNNTTTPLKVVDEAKFRVLEKAELGSGGFARVCKAIDKEGDEVAAKVFTAGALDDFGKKQMLNNFEQELNTLDALPNHERLVTILGHRVDMAKGKAYIFMELSTAGSLDDRIAAMDNGDNSFPILPEPLVKKYFRQILEGLSVLHNHKSKAIFHADIKPGNMLLFGKDLKLTDFGISKVTGHSATEGTKTKKTEVAASDLYLAPESFREKDGKKQYSIGRDLWAVACSVQKMLTGRRPWSGCDEVLDKNKRPDGDNLMRHMLLLQMDEAGRPKLGQVYYPPFPSGLDIDEDLREVLMKLFSFDPKDRGTADEILAMRYFGTPATENPVHIGQGESLKFKLNDLSAYKDKTPKYSTLNEAATHADGAESIKILVANGHDINETKTDEDARTPIFRASGFGHLELVELLHSLGANVNTPMKRGATPVFIAAQNGHAEVVKALHSLGANVNTPKNDGATPVFIAAYKGHVEVVKVLHSLGTNVNTPQNDGATPVYIAAFNGHAEVVKVLHSLGANVNTPTNTGCTPVYIAAQEGQAEVVNVLHSSGADLTASWRGHTPLATAKKNGHRETARVIQSLQIFSKLDS